MIKKVRNIINNTKYFVIILIAMILVFSVLCFMSFRTGGHFSTSSGDLEVDYGRNEIIEFKNINNGFSKQIDITVSNDSDDLKIYSLSWYNLNNSLADQQNFLYQIKCDDYECPHFDNSQVPSFDSDIFTDVFLEGHFKHKYKIIFTYNGSGNKQTFSGKLVVNQSITDRDKVIEKLKERAAKSKQYDDSVSSTVKQK